MLLCEIILLILGLWYGCGLIAVLVILFVDTVLRGQKITNHDWDELANVYFRGPISLYWLYQLRRYLR